MMQSEIFRFKAATGEESMNNAVHMLKSVKGVNAVTGSLSRNELSVQFDTQITSKQSLQDALLGAGYGIEASRGGECGSGNCSCS